LTIIHSLAHNLRKTHQINTMPVITAVAYKPTPDSKVGIAFVANRISKISATSLFASSDLRVGQQVLSINDEPVNGKSATEMAAVIASAPEEVKIKVIAEASVPVITAVANKPTPDSKVGIAFVANRISKINEGSFFASSDLRVGHTVVSINDKPADGKSATLAAIIASAPKEVKIKVIAGPNVEINKSKAPNGAPEGGIW
jgi:membrane-associated protease RseP (regulator of RpoE activity)